MNRRTFTASVLGASGLVLAGTRASSESGNAGSWKSTHSGVFFIGAMPWVRLFDGARQVCWASIIHADWSLSGAGRLLILRQQGRRRILGDNKPLLHWLREWLLQPANANERPVGSGNEFEQCEVALEIDPATGLRAQAGDVLIEMSGPLDRRLIRRERYPLGDFFPTCSWTRVACERARVTIGGNSLSGNPNLTTDAHGRSSTAQINIAEVWTT